MATKWGIAGAGKISHDFLVCLESAGPEEHEVIGVVDVYNRKSAEEFAAQYNIPKVYASFQELAADSEVDVVYIGVLHPWHLQVGTIMLNAGKNVLCEKPLGMNARETSELLGLAKKNNVFLMEAISSRCFPAYRKLRELITSGSIGEVKHFYAAIGIDMSETTRVQNRELGGGATLDIGVYAIQLATLAFNGEKPIKITADGLLNETSADQVVSFALTYSGGRMANAFVSTVSGFVNEAMIVGTKGTIRVCEPFWLPTRLETPTGPIVFRLPSIFLSYFNFHHSEGLRYEAEEVRRCLRRGLKESPLLPHSETQLLADVMERIRKQIGVEYPQDKVEGSITK